MEQSLVKSLTSILPRNFRGSPSVTCGDGWYLILADLVVSVAYYEMEQNSADPLVQFISFKEKFGTLRAACQTDDPFIRGLISAAENLSSRTCESCGATKRVGRTDGWLKTICRTCALKGHPDEEWHCRDMHKVVANLNRVRTERGTRYPGTDVLWLDDLRDPSDHGMPHAVWAKDSQTAKALIAEDSWDVISLDHDLGEDSESDGASVAKYLVELALDGVLVKPMVLMCHSANTVGKNNIQGYFSDFRKVIATASSTKDDVSG